MQYTVNTSYVVTGCPAMTVVGCHNIQQPDSSVVVLIYQRSWSFVAILDGPLASEAFQVWHYKIKIIYRQNTMYVGAGMVCYLSNTYLLVISHKGCMKILGASTTHDSQRVSLCNYVHTCTELTYIHDVIGHTQLLQYFTIVQQLCIQTYVYTHCCYCVTFQQTAAD